MSEELEKTDPGMLDNAEELDSELVELPDELLEEIAGGGYTDITRHPCPKCGQYYLQRYIEDGKVCYVYCRGCKYRRDI